MAKNNELLLAFEFEKAPVEVKQAAAAHRDAWVRVERAKSQAAKWVHESTEAEVAYGLTGSTFKKLLDAWDPAAKKDPKLEEKK